MPLARGGVRIGDQGLQTRVGGRGRKDRGIVDEAPKAYKNIERVMEQQQDLVEIVAELKQEMLVS